MGHRDVPAPSFFYWVIRNTAWEWTNKRKREVPNDVIEIDDKGAAERGILAKFDVMKILALFEDDLIAKKIVMAEMDGARGEELLKLSGLSLTEYESKRARRPPPQQKTANAQQCRSHKALMRHTAASDFSEGRCRARKSGKTRGEGFSIA